MFEAAGRAAECAAACALRPPLRWPREPDTSCTHLRASLASCSMELAPWPNMAVGSISSFIRRALSSSSSLDWDSIRWRLTNQRAAVALPAATACSLNSLGSMEASCCSSLMSSVLLSSLKRRVSWR